ncbi:acyl carrier protein [Ascoidea rubescens DSM 1968]|uniref:Acyl carrier protein n=1 Tax=Ascoidea rubescens DSM 1968 TaxID=1344418 RepID=A0A1D2VPL7_9ASCO|nr:acyl carrier protein [Ascoidea rubescens DSM 1968]ODV63539.1 acyl carrier protein [Ascoidea rubescens DSM 1968]
MSATQVGIKSLRVVNSNFLRSSVTKRCFSLLPKYAKSSLFITPLNNNTHISGKLFNSVINNRCSVNNRFNNQVRNYSGGVELTREIATQRLLEILEGFDKTNLENLEKLGVESSYTKDLGLDSLDVVEVIMAIEEEFSIQVPDNLADEFITVKQTIDFIMDQPDAF